ncbi:hypothetical protein [Aquabacterium sp.]|uniref:hypothetical protein n=1 Tax=Aquabacterium sp. TaxID=1872578 RepID=UPI0035B2D92C
MWMWIIAIGWMFVVVIAALVEAFGTPGSVLGGIVTLLFYGVVPLGLLMYVLGTPLRRKARLAQEQLEREVTPADTTPSVEQPDTGGLPTGDPLPPIRKEP